MEAALRIVRDYQYFGWLAFIAAVFFTPLAMRAAHRWGVLDMPDRTLKPHARPTPYLGGAAICAAWSLSLLLAMVFGVGSWEVLLPLMLGGVAMSVLGLVDDVRHLAPKVRLAIGALIIFAALALTGTGTRLVDVVLYGLAEMTGWPIILPAFVTVPISLLIGVVLVLGACNSTNLIDGLDGLCSGVTSIVSLGFFVLAGHLAVYEYSATGDPVRLVLAIAMVGAAMGFLPWNFNPAKIFMGDAGSMLLGYNCGVLILLFAERGTFRWSVGALMIFALPVFDTALAMFRRWRAGRSIFEGDRSHFYDQLVQRGFSVKQTVLICYALALVYALVGLLVTWVDDGGPVIRTRYTVPFFLAVAAVTALIAWAMGLTTPEERRSKSDHSSEPTS